MKKKYLFYMACALCGALIWQSRAMAAEEQPRTSWSQEATQEFRQDASEAGKEMQKAGEEMGQAGQELKQAGSSLFDDINVPAPAKPAGQTTAKKKYSDVQRRPILAGTNQDARTRALQGSPETGYAGTWKDPATGDIMTSVIAPAPKPSNTQSYPLFIEPQINGSDWYSSNTEWNPIWNGGNSNWGQPGWNQPQWPGYPGDTGYMPPPPPPPPPGPGFRPVPPGVPPNQPYNPNFPVYNPYNPSWTPFPPPDHPGYRPLRPNRPGINKPGNPGLKPPPGQWQPGMPPPGANPPPNQGWQPGMPPPPPGPGGNWGQPGWHPINPGGPGHGPDFRPLPMRPGGQTWGGGPNGGPRPGGFGRGGL